MTFWRRLELDSNHEELLKLRQGASLAKGTSFGSVESVKAVEDMYAPIAGEVVQRNEAVLASPEELQNDPHGEGWLLVLRPSDPSELDSLMTAEAYGAKVNAG